LFFVSRWVAFDAASFVWTALTVRFGPQPTGLMYDSGAMRQTGSVSNYPTLPISISRPNLIAIAARVFVSHRVLRQAF
jgi:hypothetical protein